MFGYCGSVVRLRNLRDLRETLGVLLWRLIESSCVYSPADGADYADECSRLHYIAEKDRLFKVKTVLGFWGLSAIISGICERLIVSFVQIA